MAARVHCEAVIITTGTFLKGLLTSANIPSAADGAGIVVQFLPIKSESESGLDSAETRTRRWRDPNHRLSPLRGRMKATAEPVRFLTSRLGIDAEQFLSTSHATTAVSEKIFRRAVAGRRSIGQSKAWPAVRPS